MSASDDDRRAKRVEGEGDDALAGGEGGRPLSIDLEAWQPPPVRAGMADEVLRRMREPLAVTPHEIGERSRRRWSPWVAGGAAVAAAAVAAGLLAGTWGTRGAPAVPETHEDHGDLVAERASHLEIGATSAEVDSGAALSWRRERARVSIAQQRGAATWRVGAADTVVIDAGATGASVEASGASLRVEVHMQVSSSDARLVGASVATAAVVSLVTVIVYQGYVKATSGGQTVSVAAGRTVEIRPGERPREALDVAAAPAERTVALATTEAPPPPPPPPSPPPGRAVAEAALLGVMDEVTACLAGQSVQLTADGWARPDGTIERISVEPPGPVASCVAGAIRNVRFPPTATGVSFHREFSGDPTAKPPRTIQPSELDKLRIKGEKNILPDEADKLAIESAARISGETGIGVRLIASIKMCVDRTGKVSHVRVLKSSGYPGYDHKLQTEVMGWQYRPYEVDGKAVPVCTAITFIYTQK